VTAADARLREAEVNLAYTRIVSPVDGVVVARNIDVGQTVAASFQTPTLFLVAEDLTKMQVNASVSESDIGSVAPDQDVAFAVDAYPNEAFHGRVIQVRNAPVTVQNVVTYDVVVEVDNSDLRLKPGMTATVTITTAERPDVLRVRTTALRFRPPPSIAESGATANAAPNHPPAVGDPPRVWRLDGQDHPYPVTVSTGVADDRYTEITSGLAEGDVVIIALRREPTTIPAGRLPSFAQPPPRPGGGRR
jgi:HlyD family secretion protein